MGRKRAPEVRRKSEAELALMRQAGRVVAVALERIREMLAPGVTTAALDRAARETLASENAQSSFLGYRQYPAVICVEINDTVVHGIPSEDVALADGDVVGVDFGAIYNGYHGDGAFTAPVGDVSDEKLRLLAVTEESLRLAIAAAQVGNRLGDICGAIQQHVESHGFNVVRDLVGHGIGRSMHEPPQVPNFLAPGQFPEYDSRLRPGMTFAIEPMVTMGGYEVKVGADGWQVLTVDGLPSAHFEHTIAVAKDGPRILTLP